MAEVEMDAEMQAFANDVLPSPCRYLASHKKGVSIMLDDPITRTPDEDTVIGFVTRNPTRPHQLVAWVTRSPTRPCRVYDIIFVAACAMMTGATGRFAQDALGTRWHGQSRRRTGDLFQSAGQWRGGFGSHLCQSQV